MHRHAHARDVLARPAEVQQPHSLAERNRECEDQEELVDDGSDREEAAPQVIRRQLRGVDDFGLAVQLVCRAVQHRELLPAVHNLKHNHLFE